ncbi:MAG: HEAT repeat domain-containing protein [Candidatus Binatia bacterium]
MEEGEFLNRLSKPDTETKRRAWEEGQIEDNLLWRACRAAVTAPKPKSLDRWHQAVDDSRTVIARCFGEQHVTSASALLACAELAGTAKTVTTLSVESLVKVFHHAAKVLGYTCNHDADHGVVETAMMTNNALGAKTSARGSGSVAVDAIDRVFRFLAEGKSSCTSAHLLSWTWDVTRELLEHPRHVVHRCDIPVAGVNGDRGFLATLVLEVVEPGCGAVFHDPQDAFRTNADDEFVSSMVDTWQVPCAKMNVNNRDGRWRLLHDWHPEAQVRERLSTAAEANGRSASGAGLYGWYHALTGTRPDDRLVVVMQAGQDGQLEGVDGEGVFAKTKAIVTEPNGHFDTIVVATEDNAAKVEAALRECGKKCTIKLPTTFEQLVTIRSHLVEEVQAYLNDLAQKMAKLSEYYPAHLRTDNTGTTRFDDIRQLVQVVEDRRKFEKWVAEEREGLRAAGQDIDRLAYKPTRARPELGEDDEARYDDRPPPPPPIPWDDHAGERFQRAVILGDPGFGKTWLLRYEARRLAREGTRQLQERTIDLDQLCLPIFARLSDINQSDDSLEDALVAPHSTRRSRVFCRFAREKLTTEHCVILLDAWDEVPVESSNDRQSDTEKPSSRERLGQLLENFARQFAGPRILLTSRIVGYGRSPIPTAAELELLAFDLPQTESFVRVWFGANPETATRFLSTLDQNPQVRGLARIPLMLALMCRSYQEKQLNFSTRRVDLYDCCLRGLLGDWKYDEEERREPKVDEENSEPMLELLQTVGYTLFIEGHEQFRAPLLRKKIGEWLATLPQWHEFFARNPTSLIAELKRDGILITIGEHRDAPFLFLHRTFHEYLAASALAQQGWETIAELIDHKAWLPEWQEIIVLLAGQLPDPEPLLAMLSNPEPTKTNPHGDDYFRHRLALAGLCLPEIPVVTRRQLSRRTEAITRVVFDEWWDHRMKSTQDTIVHFDRALRAVGYVNAKINGLPLVDNVARLLVDGDAGVRRIAIEAMGVLGSQTVTPAFLEALARLLADADRHVRQIAIKAVGALGSAAATLPIIEPLIQLLEGGDKFERMDATSAVCRMGRDAAKPAMLESLARLLAGEDWKMQDAAALPIADAIMRRAPRDRFVSLEGIAHGLSAQNVQRDAAQVVGAIGSAAATSPILEALAQLMGNLREYSSQDPNDAGRRIAVAAAEAVSKIGSAALKPEIVEALVRLLADKSRDVRMDAADAVRRIGSPATNRPILEGLSPFLADPDARVREAATESVGRMGSAAATPVMRDALVQLLADPDPNVQRAAADAVGRMGSAAATPVMRDALVQLLADPRARVREAAADAVGGMGSAAATPVMRDALVQLLADPGAGVRVAAAKAVGRGGNGAVTAPILEALVQLLADDNEHVRWITARAVGRIGSAAATSVVQETLVRLLADQDVGVRRVAAKAVGGIGSRAATLAMLEALTQLLTETYSYPGGRAAIKEAAEAVGKLGNVAATPPILKALARLLTDRDVNMRRAAAKAVGGIGSRAVTPAMLEALAQVLTEIYSDPRETSYRPGMIIHEDAEVVEAVGRLGSVAATPSILKALARLLTGRRDVDVRQAVANVVRRIGSPATNRHFFRILARLLDDQDVHVRMGAAEAVHRIWSLAANRSILGALARLLADPDLRVQGPAAKAMGGIMTQHRMRFFRRPMWKRFFGRPTGRWEWRSVEELIQERNSGWHLWRFFSTG